MRVSVILHCRTDHNFLISKVLRASESPRNSAWNFSAASGRLRAKSSKASTSPKANPASVMNWRRRASSSSTSARAAGSAASPYPGIGGLAGRQRKVVQPRIPGVQPGARHAAEGRPAAGAVARHPAARDSESDVQGGARRRLRTRAGGHVAVGGVRGARDAVSGRLHRVADGRREERQSRSGPAAVHRLREDHRQRQAQDDVGADVSRDPVLPVDRRGHGDHGEGGAGVRGFLRRLRRGAAVHHARPDRDLRRDPQQPAADHARARSAAAWRSGGGSRCRASACGCTRR